MTTSRVTRRAFCALLAATGSAHALGRTPLGGSLRLALPLSLSELDPHVLDDPLAALFAPAIADPLYALDGSGRPYPALASAMPEASAEGVRVRLRPGLVSGRGKTLDARDAAFSLARARRAGASGILAPFGEPKVESDHASLLFTKTNADELALALAHPLTALVPRGFSRIAPDGSGAFTATLSGSRLVLTRNLRAARGAAFLDRVEVAKAGDLAQALRAFESASADVGWLGSGLYRARPGAKTFVGPVYGWVVLRNGRDAKSWGAAGLAQQLCDSLPAEQLTHLGVIPEPGLRQAVSWGGDPAELCVVGDSPHLNQIASAIAALLSKPGHEITTVSLPRAEFDKRRSQRRYALMLDFVRGGQGGKADQLSLLAAADPELARRPPRLEELALRDLARTLPLGVVGALRVSGAQTPEFVGLQNWQLGSIWRKTRP